MMLEIVVVICIAFSFICFSTYVTHFRRNNSSFPPGPIPLPIIGNLHQLGLNAHENLRVLSKRYGSVMRILIGSEVAIVVCGTKEVLEGLVTKSVEFAGRPMPFTLSLTTGGKGIAFADYSPRWKFFRKISHASMKMFGNGVDTIEGLVKSQSSELDKRLDKKLGRPINLHYDLGLTVLNVVFAMIFGRQYSIGDEEFEKLMHSTTLFVRGFEYDSFIDVFPILRYLPNRRIKTLQHAIELRTPIVKKHLELHKASFHKRASKNKDLCYALLEQLEQAKTDGSAKQEYLTDELMVSVLDDMIGAGSETTLTVLRWSIVYLVNNDDVQEECYNEILNMIGRDKPTELSDRKLLPYVNAFVHETLRMSSIAPMAVPHKTTCDTSLGGYRIPKNSQVIFNLYAVHRSEKDFEQPFEFNPKRFLDKNGNLLPPGYHKGYLPFSAGRRCCLAESLAKMELFLVISHLIQRYKFLPAPGQPLPSMIGDPGLFLGPKPHQILIEKRDS